MQRGELRGLERVSTGLHSHPLHYQLACGLVKRGHLLILYRRPYRLETCLVRVALEGLATALCGSLGLLPKLLLD